MSVQNVKHDGQGGFYVTSPNGQITHTGTPEHPVFVAAQEWIEDGNTPEAADAAPDPTWLEKRQASVAGGGYGAITEQLEIIGEQGITAFQNHIAAVKAAIPKP